MENMSKSHVRNSIKIRTNSTIRNFEPTEPLRQILLRMVDDEFGKLDGIPMVPRFPFGGLSNGLDVSLARLRCDG